MNKAARRRYRKKNNLSVREYRAQKNNQLQIKKDQPRRQTASRSNMSGGLDYQSAFDNFSSSRFNDMLATNSRNSQRLSDFLSTAGMFSSLGGGVAPPRFAPPRSGPPRSGPTFFPFG